MLQPDVGDLGPARPFSPTESNSLAEGSSGLQADGATDWAPFWLDLSGNIARWGARPAALFSVPREQVIGKHVSALFSREARAAGIPRQALRSAHDEGGWDSICVLGFDDSRCRRFSVHVSYVTTPNGLPIGYMLVARAVEAQTDSPSNSRRLLEAGRLAGDVAHEVGNLFAAIRGFAGVLEGVLPSSGTSHLVWHELIKACDRGKHLTRRLLDAGRDESVEAIDLASEVATLEPVLRQLLPREIQLILRPGQGLPLVRGRSCEIESVLTNLVLNARDAIDGEGIIQISATARTDPTSRRRYVELVVQDSGRGMSPAVAARAFERFFSTKRGSGGSGVGLSVVQDAVASMGGTVELEDGYPSGTCARVRIPPALAPIAEDSRHAVDLLGKGVFVLASDRVLRECIEDLLVRQGIGVTAVAEGIADEEMGRALVAIIAPRSLEEGDSTLAQLLAAEPDTRVLMISDEVSDAAAEAGVRHLTTHFTPSELIEAVRALPAEGSPIRSSVN